MRLLDLTSVPFKLIPIFAQIFNIRSIMKYILTLIAIITLCSAHAQEQAAANDSIPFEFNRQAYIYNLAKSYNDPVVARMAIYNLLSYNPQNPALLDSLALLYYEYNQFASAALTAQDAAALDPEDMFAVEIAAICFERLGALPKAITFYEKLYTTTFDMSTLYKVGFLQMDAKRYIEADTNADIIIEDPKSKTLTLLFPKDNKQNQEVSLVAGGYRLKGMIAEAQGDKVKAKEYFNKGLAIAPDFDLLKKQIAELEK